MFDCVQDAADFEDLCAKLERGILYGCPPAAEGDWDEELCFLDAYTSAGRSALEAGVSDLREAQRRKFAQWLCHALCLRLDVAESAVDVLIAWLEFAHLGKLTRTTPSWWLLCWAGCPFSWSTVQQLENSGERKWLHVWIHEFHTTPWAFSEWVRDMAHLWCASSEKKIRRGVADTIVQWLANAAAEVTPCSGWYLDGGREAAMLEILGTLGGGGPDIVYPVMMRTVLSMESRMGVRMPADLRRLLLEVGDCGIMLFGLPLVPPTETHRLCAGKWRWSVQHAFDPVRLEEVVAGAMWLGWWYQSCQLSYLVTDGERRGQVWIVDEDTDHKWTLIHLEQTAMRRRAVGSPASEFVAVVRTMMMHNKRRNSEAWPGT
jgi:hypothetical protein